MPTNVTVIVPTFNRAKYLPECLDSLINQSAPAARILVVDDGSTDETPDVVKGFGPAVHGIRQKNSGKSVALNRALPEVDSEYVWIFDDDDVAAPDAIEHHLAALNRDSNAGFSYSSYQRAKSDVNGGILPGLVRLAESFRGRGLFVRLLEENLLPQPSIMVRTSCYRELGPFDERLVRSQDFEMLLRLSRRFSAVAVKDITYYYRQHDGARGSTGDSFAVNAVDDKWIKYDRIIFSELYESLSLWEYLPELASERSLTPSEQQAALVRRFSVMMRFCLWDQAFRDLRELLETASPTPALSDAERAGLIRIFENRALLMFRSGYSNRELIASFGKGGRKLANQLRVEMARSLYYELHRALASGNRRNALIMLTKLLPLLGIKNLFGMLGQS